MAKRSDIDKAIGNLMNWAERPAWINEQKAVFDEHIAPAAEHVGIRPDELLQGLADSGSIHMLTGIIFEDFIRCIGSRSQ